MSNNNNERIIYKGTKENELHSDGSAIHGYSSEPTVLPTTWDGTFQKAPEQELPELKPGERWVQKGTKDHELLSNASNFYGHSSEPTKLPVAWDGTFAKSGEVFIKPSRNASNPNNFFERKSHTTVMPVQWDGTFGKSGETYMKPERNNSNPNKYF
uniref:CSON009463 protein n=1 Tax=Culicoides sonorensis TaxID=179676 RepID=A0A336MCC5_CULSO